MIGFALHPEAILDLDKIWEFIAADSLDAADRFITDILFVLTAAVSTSHQGHRRPDLTSRPLRFLHIYDYLIAYADEEKPLWVVAVIHGRRNPRVIAAMLRGRQ